MSVAILNLQSFGANTIGGPLTASVFAYNPKLPPTTRARIGFLTNQPRTFGISTRLDF